MRRKRTATFVTLLSVVFWCCQHPALFMLILLLSLNSYWQLEASRNIELANIFLCHWVWSGTDSACSLWRNYCLKFPSSFDGDFSLTSLLLKMCGPLSWHVSKCFWQVFSERLATRVNYQVFSPLWPHLYHLWPVDGDVNLPRLYSLPGSSRIPLHRIHFPFFVVHSEKREVLPHVEGHATNSWPPLKTMKLLIQDAW